MSSRRERNGIINELQPLGSLSWGCMSPLRTSGPRQHLRHGASTDLVCQLARWLWCSIVADRRWLARRRRWAEDAVAALFNAASPSARPGHQSIPAPTFSFEILNARRHPHRTTDNDSSVRCVAKVRRHGNGQKRRRLLSRNPTCRALGCSEHACRTRLAETSGMRTLPDQPRKPTKQRRSDRTERQRARRRAPAAGHHRPKPRSRRLRAVRTVRGTC